MSTMHEELQIPASLTDAARRTGGTTFTPSSLTYLGRTLEDAAVFSAVIFKAGAAGPDTKSPQEIFVRIMLGLELRLGPMTAIRELFVTKGRCGMSSRLMHSLLRREGGRIRIMTATEKLARIELYPPHETEPSTFEWTLEMASKANLLGKTTWQQYPMQLLLNRAISMGVNFAAPEVLGGGMYEITELQDIDDTGVDTAITPAGSTKDRVASRVSQFDSVFTKRDPFKPKGRNAVESTATTEDAPPATDDSPPADPNDMGTMTEREAQVARDVAVTDAPKAEARKRAAPRKQPVAATKLDRGSQALAVAISEAALEAKLLLLGGLVEIAGDLAGHVGLEAGNYSVTGLCDQVNAHEILQALRDAKVVVEDTNGQSPVGEN